MDRLFCSGWRKLCSNKDYVAYQILSMTLVLSCLAHRSREDIVWELCYNEPYKNDVDGLTMTGSPCSILSTLPSMHMIMGLGFEYVTCFKININKVQNFGDRKSHKCLLPDILSPAKIRWLLTWPTQLLNQNGHY